MIPTALRTLRCLIRSLLLLALAVPATAGEPATPDVAPPKPATPKPDGSPEAADRPAVGSEPSAADDDETATGEEAATEPPLHVYRETLTVGARADDLVGIAVSATEGAVGYEDLQLRPIHRTGELVEAVPGIIATQHSGGGKANQYFLRGFNLDHGTDFSVHVDGVPVNMPSHGHGQGYADLNFLIPELVATMHFRKGPYYPDTSDFSAAGSVEIGLLREVPRPFLSLTGGSFGDGRVLWGQSFRTEGSDVLAALDVFHSDGPWDRGDDYEGVRGLLRVSRGDALRGSSLTALAYSADWLSTDQVPARAVSSGLIDRFGLIDPGPRGSTDRFSLSAELHRGGDRSLTRVNGYVVSYDFGLISNFTYALDNPEEADQFEQADDRIVAGVGLDHRWSASWRGRAVEHRAGVDVRLDLIENGLYRTRDLERFATTREDEIEQWSGGPWVETQVRWTPWLATRAGLRAQGFQATVDSDRRLNSGSELELMLHPKLSVIVGPWSSTELYFNVGSGFHSNDARGAVIAVDPATGEPTRPVPPLVRARGADLGLRTTRVPGLHSTISLFVLETDSELVFVGDGGATEVSRPSRRIGVEIANHYRLTPRLMLDLDATLSDARFTDRDPAGDEIPGAVETTLAAGLSLVDRGPFFGSLRWRYFAGAPLIEDGSVRSSSSSLVNAEIGYEFASGLDLALQVFNVFDREDSDIEYFYASRLPGEPAGGVEDVHFHPVEGRSVRLRTTWRF